MTVAGVQTLTARLPIAASMSSSSFISPSTQLVVAPSQSSTPVPSPSPEQQRPRFPSTGPSPSPFPPSPSAPPPAAPPARVLLLAALSALLSRGDFVLQLLFTVTTSLILSVRQQLARVIAPIRSTYVGHLLSVLFYAAVPLPLSPETMFAPPFPLAGSANAEDREIAANGPITDAGTRLSLYMPVVARRLRKHTVRIR